MSEHNDREPADLARVLREMRLQSGNPTLDSMAKRTGLSRTLLSDTFNGKQPPSDNTLYRLAQVFETELSELQALRDRTRTENVDRTEPKSPEESEPGAGQAAAPHAPSTVTLEATSPSAASGGGRSKWHATSVTLGSLVLCSVLAGILGICGAVATTMVVQRWAGSADPAEEPATGVDPMESACRDDAVNAVVEKRMDGRFVVEMIYSSSCSAVWGKVTRYDAGAGGNFVQMRIFRAEDPQGADVQERRWDNAQSVHTPMIVTTEANAEICGIAAVQVDGDTLELGPQVCI
ncbi:DUF2690 domain-containing protein [Brevibacterium sp.]|uniref:DUF2690 domain-containing protein n=1 Tax=Brevibacterium sp. TaxID=1701 RepID=UPI00281170F8|nr:DUF2690 domain-containing protein [Brevibacterium sp.]